MSDDRAPYPAWIYRQSAVIPYRRDGDRLQVLLITSRSGKRWVVPKGIVEPGMSPVESALREAHEEAGVDGIAGETSLGTYRYRKWGGTCVVEVYPLEVVSELDDWPEAPTRRRRWFTPQKASRRVGKKGLRPIIDSLAKAATARGEPRATTAGDESLAPARLVHLFRHAKSSWEDPSLADDDRPLAARGERACDAMRRYMALADIDPDFVACSSAVRTRQTLERVLPAFDDGVEVKHYRGLYGAAPQAMLDRLRRTPESAGSVMLVGHCPGIQTLAMRLAGSGDPAEREKLATKFPTGALATLVYRGDWAALSADACELHSFVVPRDIGEDPDAGSRDEPER